MAWSTLTALTVPRAGRAAAVGSDLHLIGGRTDSVASSTDHLVFDGSSWSSAASLPSAVRSGPTTVADGIIYLGSPTTTGDFSGDLWSYNPGTDSWDTGLDDAPEPVRYLAAIGSVLYAVGENGNTLVYDPGADSWSTLAYAAPWYGPNGAMVAHDGLLWLLRGDAWSDPSGFWVFDPSTGWDTAADLPAGRENPGIGVAGGLVHVVGGWRRADPPDEDDLYQAADDHWVYDPGTDSWSSAEALPGPAVYPAVASLGSVLHVVGGVDGYLPGSSSTLDGHYSWGEDAPPSTGGWRVGRIGFPTTGPPEE